MRNCVPKRDKQKSTYLCKELRLGTTFRALGLNNFHIGLGKGSHIVSGDCITVRTIFIGSGRGSCWRGLGSRLIEK